MQTDPRRSGGGTVHPLQPFALPAADGEQHISDDPDIPAVVYFTSGSTGRPKVAHGPGRDPQRSVLTARAFALVPGTRTGWTASSAFAVSRWRSGRRFAGAEIHVADDADLADGPAFVRWLEQTGVAVTFLATARAGMLRRADFTHRCRFAAADRRAMCCARCQRCLRPALINAFGITEAFQRAASSR
ncbi:MAG: AMP-binding protein [Alphaproteobacteria bacterium]|nr:AMP-binding protein [Alphaproteobacteria bacterium]